MIFQGLFNILDLYLSEINLFYENIDNYFLKKLFIFTREHSLARESLEEGFEKLLIYLKDSFLELGFEETEIENDFLVPIHELQKKRFGMLSSIMEFYVKIVPMVYEIFLRKILDYLSNANVSSIMANLRSARILPWEFIMELSNLKRLFEKSPEKKKSLQKYLKIQEKIIQKFRENKNKIESSDDFKDPLAKLQFIYMIYRIVDFFNIQQFFDFSQIKEYIKNNSDQWLDTIPLVSLKNPDLYYCGIYLAKNLSIPLTEDDELHIKYFLLNMYDENIDEFEAPIVEATIKIYYFFKSCMSLNFLKEISEGQIKELLKGDKKYFEPNYLKDLETSQLVIILKIYNTLGVYHKIEPQKINAIIDEIEHRLTSKGIKQYRDGFISSEATYHVLFFNYMRNNLKSLNDYDLLDQIISKIYRNLEILEFSEETNYDLISELLYSCESLKLLNCIESKDMIIHLARYLFPEDVIITIMNTEEIIRESAKFRHLKIDKTTGETIYTSIT